ncbi:alanine racemase [Fictibacillus norfolkensis]|uniref:Alanine racemase n=1 Tax=Fictibacillus norfolkensis TaxID=2762233 RepID=A0ABR8SGY7_9BACL|nr:alanine racemase [Fictibacillus norfolkensis]MBD7962752.1 alanine racemase [Fictibacillus norfolkensis]
METTKIDLKLTIQEMKKKFGTPFFIFDETKLKKQYNLIRQAVPNEVSIYYSMKSNPNPTICKLLLDEGASIEVASIGEYRSLQDLGVQHQTIFTGPGKSRAEVRTVLENGILCINAESLQEIKVIQEEAKKLGITAPIALRVNPNLSSKGSRMISAGLPSQFGIDEDQIEKVIEHLLAFENVQLKGLHVYQGTQNFNLVSHEEAIKKMFSLVRWVQDRFEIELSLLGLGGGFGVPAFLEEKPFDIRSYGAILGRELKGNEDLNLQLVYIESGRFITSEMGAYVTEVLYTKKSHDKNYAILDGGTHHRAFSSLMGRNFKQPLPVSVIKKNAAGLEHKAKEEQRYTLVGKLCTPTDIIQSGVVLPEVDPEDLIIFPNSGAYGLSCGNVHFLSHEIPREYLLQKDGEISDVSWL